MDCTGKVARNQGVTDDKQFDPLGLDNFFQTLIGFSLGYDDGVAIHRPAIPIKGFDNDTLIIDFLDINVIIDDNSVLPHIDHIAPFKGRVNVEAGGLVLADQGHFFTLFGQMKGTADTRFAVAPYNYFLTDFGLAGHHIQQIHQLGRITTGALDLRINRTGGQYHRIGHFFFDQLGGDLGPQVKGDTGLFTHNLLVFDAGPKLVISVRSVFGLIKGTADNIPLIINVDFVTTPGSYGGTFQPGRTGSDDHDFFFFLCRGRIRKFRIGFVGANRIDIAGHGRIPEQPRQAQVAGDTVPNFFFPAFQHFLGHQGVGDHRTAYFPEIQFIGANFFVGQIRLKHAIGHLNRNLDMFLGPFGQMDPVAHGDVTADHRIDGLLPSQGTADIIRTGFFGHLVSFHGFFKGIATHVIQQLFGTQTNAHRYIGSADRFYCLDDFNHRLHPTPDIPAVFIGAPVGVAGNKIGDQIADDAGDFHRIKAGLNSPAGGIHMLLNHFFDFGAGHFDHGFKNSQPLGYR